MSEEKKPIKSTLVGVFEIKATVQPKIRGCESSWIGNVNRKLSAKGEYNMYSIYECVEICVRACVCVPKYENLYIKASTIFAN